MRFLRVGPCGRETMLEFAEFQQNALKLTDQLKRRSVPSLGCFCFFSVILPNTAAIEDAQTIKLVAYSLDSENDDDLLAYLKGITRYSAVTPKNINEFKNKVLTGIYLMMWSHYSSTVSNLMNSTLVELFQRDLQVSSPQKMSDTLFDSSLEALSQYCSFAYQNRNERIYDNLIRRLGTTVQANIHTLRLSREKQETSFYDIYKGIMRTLGLNSVF
ncbi:TPA: hypothetical protein F8R96_14665 [Legionella pneumophila]|nr:hypothetical protein [Legionella pneumophila]HAU1322164.1 hypothetical protein [Legionella pneumophila]HBC0466831.1 hypothetical protein [Legionella pneumophila]HBI2947795.1 hypothetical protein [Legionella pneumophila]HDV6631712.1 hypothetical protein [Legionella pneumophila]